MKSGSASSTSRSFAEKNGAEDERSEATLRVSDIFQFNVSAFQENFEAVFNVGF